MNLLPLRKLLIPIILLIAAIASRNFIVNQYAIYGQLLGLMPYVVLSITMVICAYYNRSRLFTASLALLICYILIQSQLQTSLSTPGNLLIFSSMSFLMPTTLLLLLLVPERGLYNLYGILIIAIIPIQILTILAIITYLPQEQYVSIINLSIPINHFSNYVISPAASGVFLFVLLAGLLKLIKSNNNSIASLISILLFSFITLAFFYLPKISTVMFTAAGISLIISLMSSSYDMAFRDELTGLLGRRALNDRLKGLGRRFVIAMMDVDHFKKFNDTYGHDIGDDVLKMVSMQINAVKGGGTAYRYGGEEFCVVFPSKTIKECMPFLESVRISIENYQMELRNFEHRPKS